MFYNNTVIPWPMGPGEYPWGKYKDFLEANNKTQDALEEKGYTTRYAYGLGQCHCQGDMIFEDFPNTLVWAWSEWKSLQDTQKVPINEHTFGGIPQGADG